MSRRLFTNLLLALALAAGALACSGGQKAAIVGVWEADRPRMTFEFSGNGVVTWTPAGRTFTGQYDFTDATTIELEMAGDLGMQLIYLTEVSIQGEQLSLTLEGRQVQFTRIAQ